MTQPRVSTIVRVHSGSKLSRLEDCFGALASQTGVQVEAIVVAQGITDEELAELEAIAADSFIFGNCQRAIIRIPNPRGEDLRSRLLNEGIDYHFSNTSNEYLSFLDYDDVLASNALQTLAEPLNGTRFAVSFGRVERLNYVPCIDYDFIYEADAHFSAVNKTKFDLFKENFAPLHSYLFHTAVIDRAHLTVDERLTRLEDYDLLMRIVAQYPVTFAKASSLIGFYTWPADNSHSSYDPASSVLPDEAKLEEWSRARQIIKQKRAELRIVHFASDYDFGG